jgi:transposase
MKRSVRIDRTNHNVYRIQVVTYFKRKPVILKHIGSAYSHEDVATLTKDAEDWIASNQVQDSLFPEIAAPATLDQYTFRGILHTYTYEVLSALYTRLGFEQCALLRDLVVMRIVEPASKRRSLQLLERYFGITYSEKQLKTFIGHKAVIEATLVSVAQHAFKFDFSFVLYDVTTLYFESFTPDELRRPGFSKDKKFEQPQIVIGLLVTPEGFPVSWDVFAGNTFEGTTFLPSILAFKKKHSIKTLTVVADAAMLSRENMQLLDKEGLLYIVGARLGNVSDELFAEVTKVPKKDMATLRTQTDLGTLIVSYTTKRYTKDLHELNKQTERAKKYIEKNHNKKPALVTTTGSVNELNTERIERKTALLGLKGYYTNLADVSDADIIAHYHSLWHVEKAFRMAKSDLATRPIFHTNNEHIKAHILMCVVALALGVYIEQKTTLSLRAFLDEVRVITDAQLTHVHTNQRVVKRVPVSKELQKLVEKVSH